MAKREDFRNSLEQYGDMFSISSAIRQNGRDRAPCSTCLCAAGDLLNAGRQRTVVSSHAEKVHCPRAVSTVDCVFPVH